MGVITQEIIKLEGFKELYKCSKCNMINKPGEHPVIEIQGEISKEYNVSDIIKRLQNQLIKVKNRASSGEYVTIFCGYIDEVEVNESYEDSYNVMIKLISSSCKVDHKKYYRSYQDVQKNHKDIILQVANDLTYANVQCDFHKDKPIGMPLIQYYETNWEFMKRVASECNEAILVDERSEILRIVIGAKKKASKGTIKSSRYSMGVSDSYFKKKAFANNIDKFNFSYVEVETKDIYSVGDTVTFDGHTYLICEKRSRLDGTELLFKYILASEEYLYQKEYNNLLLAGCTILGTVEKTSNETLELNLELQDENNNSTKYPYEWVPETGNLMYCMPKVGTKVSLYFASASEKSAKAINCIRTNASSSGDGIYKKEEKTFATEHDNGMVLAPDFLLIATQQVNEKTNQLMMVDDEGALAVTKNKIVFNAGVGIGCNTNNLFINAKGKINTNVCADKVPVSYILQDQYLQMGSKTLAMLTSKNITDYKNINDAPIRKDFSWWDLAKNIAAGLLVVAAVTAAVAVTVATCGAAGPVIAGAVIGGAAAGTIAVGTMAYDDYKNGEVSSMGKFCSKVAIKTFVGATTGAISGGVGNAVNLGRLGKVAGLGIEFASSTTGVVIEDVSCNAIDGKDLTDGLGLDLAINTITFGLFDAKGLNKIGHGIAGTRPFRYVKDAVSNSSVGRGASRAFSAISDSAGSAKRRIFGDVTDDTLGNVLEADRDAAKNIIKNSGENSAATAARNELKDATNDLVHNVNSMRSQRNALLQAKRNTTDRAVKRSIEAERAALKTQIKQARNTIVANEGRINDYNQLISSLNIQGSKDTLKNNLKPLAKAFGYSYAKQTTSDFGKGKFGDGLKSIAEDIGGALGIGDPDTKEVVDEINNK